MRTFDVRCGYTPARDSFDIWIWDSPHHIWRDGVVWAVEVGVEVQPSLSIPGHMAGDFAKAVAEWYRDRTFDPDTEAKVLRESLIVERERVDRLLQSVLPRD